MGAMKAVVSGFVSRSPDGEKGIYTRLFDRLTYSLMPLAVKRKPSTSLAVYDIALLEAWYRVACEVRGKRFNHSHPASR